MLPLARPSARHSICHAQLASWRTHGASRESVGCYQDHQHSTGQALFAHSESGHQASEKSKGTTCRHPLFSACSTLLAKLHLAHSTKHHYPSSLLGVSCCVLARAVFGSLYRYE